MFRFMDKILSLYQVIVSTQGVDSQNTYELAKVTTNIMSQNCQIIMGS